MPSPLPPPVSPDPAALARQARRLAHLDAAPWLNREVGRRLAEKLQPIKAEPHDWVDWNAFLGAAADEVRARYPQARRWVVETTAELQAPRSDEGALRDPDGTPWWRRWRLAPAGRRAEVAGRGWPEGGAQMLWANMTLHTQENLGTMFAQWHEALAVDGFLMCSGLGPDTARELRDLYRQLGWPLPTIDFIDMHDLGDALVAAGFADPVMDMERLTLTWESPSDLLKELRTWGGNVAHGRHQGLRTPRWQQRLLEEMAHALRRPDGRLGLTVEVVYGHAIKPAPRAAVAPETRFSMDEMRQMIRSRGSGAR